MSLPNIEGHQGPLPCHSAGQKLAEFLHTVVHTGVLFLCQNSHKSRECELSCVWFWDVSYEVVLAVVQESLWGFYTGSPVGWRRNPATLQIFAWMSVLGLSPRQGLELLGYFKTRVKTLLPCPGSWKMLGRLSSEMCWCSWESTPSGANPVWPKEILRCFSCLLIRGKRDRKPTALRPSTKSLVSTCIQRTICELLGSQMALWPQGH